MAGVFWYDGTWTTEEPKIVGPMDHAFWLGSVIFDGARAIKGWAPDLDRHCARAVASARAMLMKPTKTADEIEALCREGIRRMGPDAELYVRPMFFIRKGLGAARPDPDSTDFILSIYDSPIPQWAGFSAVMAPFRRPTPEMAPTDAKAACLYPNGARASAFAATQGADNAVMCDAMGHVAEFASANLWFAKDGQRHHPGGEPHLPQRHHPPAHHRAVQGCRRVRRAAHREARRTGNGRRDLLDRQLRQGAALHALPRPRHADRPLRDPGA